MTIYFDVPEYRPQFSVGDVVNVFDPESNGFVAAKVQDEPGWWFSEIDGFNYANYATEKIRFVASGDFPRMPDGGCNNCYGTGCIQCSYSGGY